MYVAIVVFVYVVLNLYHSFNIPSSPKHLSPAAVGLGIIATANNSVLTKVAAIDC